MPHESFLSFLIAARDDRSVLARYDGRNLAQIVFHARNEGYDFTPEDVSLVVGALEANVILAKDKSTYDGTAPLWRRMWGRTHLDYVVKEVVQRHTHEELCDIIGSIVHKLP
jgi:hypothetical protein